MIPFRFYKKIANDITIDDLYSEIKFNKQKINSNGSWVEEPRLTCWMSDTDATLNYSDKEMIPSKMTPTIKKIQSILYDKFNINFDCVLANYYKDNTVGMRYHSDPLENGKWDTNFIIISFGIPRKLIFREIGNIDNKYTFEMRNGEVVHMFNDCQEKYQHCLKKEKNYISPRISLVFKRLNK